jgi:DNA mismatch repair protein MutS2
VHEQDLQRTIDQLEVKLREAQVKEEEAEAARQEAQALRLEALENSKEAQSTLQSAKQRQAKEIDQDYQLGRDYIKHLIADLQKNPSISKAQKAQQDLDRVKHELGWADGSSSKADGQPARAPRIVLGETVKVLSLNQRGIVSDVPADAGTNPAALISVRCGAMKVRVIASDLEVIHVERPHVQQAPSAKKKRADGGHAGSSNSPYAQRAGTPARAVDVFVRTMNNTLDLRGQRVDDALSNFERFLDESALAGVSPVMVIHGHGTGAVRNAVRDHLRQSEYAHSFKPGEHFEGGDGVTLIQL